MKLSQFFSVVVALGLLGVMAGCSSESPAKTAQEVKDFQTSDFSRAPAGTRESIEAANKSGAPAAALKARQGAK